MKISFTGIHNPYMYAHNHDVILNARTPEGEIVEMPSKECLIQLNCDLSDDKYDKNKENQDLGEFYNAMRESKFYCVDPNNPSKVEIKAHSYIIDNEYADGAILDFKINDFPIELNKPSDRSLLPLYSFMAKLSSKVLKMGNISSEQKEMAKIMNDYVHAMAMNFIDNIME